MTNGEKSLDGKEGGGHRSSVSSGSSVCSSDAEDESWHSPFHSQGCRSFNENYDPEIGGGVSEQHSRSSSSAMSDRSSVVDLENGIPEIKVHLAKEEKDCRICHLSLDSANPESGIPIELGCSCKEDLAAAHKHCAEAWFKIKGNKTCEICGATARNVVGATEPEVMEQWNETGNVVPVPSSETRSFWRGHRFLNFLLACMVFAFVISWLFHFNVPS